MPFFYMEVPFIFVQYLAWLISLAHIDALFQNAQAFFPNVYKKLVLPMNLTCATYLGEMCYHRKLMINATGTMFGTQHIIHTRMCF